MPTINPIFAIAAVIGLAIGTGAAADVSWRAVTAADLGPKERIAQRSPNTLDLTAKGDFDGDRQPDRAWLIRSDDSYAIMVDLGTTGGKARQYVVGTGPLAHLASRGLTTTTRASALSTLANKKDAGARATVAQSHADTLLQAFTYESSAAVFVWNGNGFTQIDIAD